jgi:sec-independent protein translocase protein TatA
VRRSVSGNITLPIRYEWIERCKTYLQTKHIGDFFLVITIGSIMNLLGPDLMVILLIVLLLFGAKKLPELARGMGRAVKEFGAARDEIERELSDSSPSATTQAKLLNKTRDRPETTL